MSVFEALFFKDLLTYTDCIQLANFDRRATVCPLWVELEIVCFYCLLIVYDFSVRG